MNEPAVRILKGAEGGYEGLRTSQTGSFPAGITKPAVPQSQLSHMPRTAASLNVRVALFTCVVVASLVCGCRTSHQTKTSPIPPACNASPRYFIVGRAGATNVTPEHRFVIQDTTFVHELFAALSAPSTNRLRSLTWMAPRPYVFVDEHWEVCRGFKSRVGTRSFVFQACWVERSGTNYIVTRGVGGSCSAP